MSNTEPTIIVRQATEADLDKYLELSADFHAASPMQKVCQFDPEGFREFVLGAIDNPDICILLAELNGEYKSKLAPITSSVVIFVNGIKLLPVLFPPLTVALAGVIKIRLNA